MVIVMLVAVLGCVSLPCRAQTPQADIDAKLAEINTKLGELDDLKAELLGLRDSLQTDPDDDAGESGWEDKIKLTGYFQARANYRDWGEDDFDLRRLYISLVAKPNDRTTAVATWTRVGGDPSMRSNTDWVNIFVDYDWSDQWTTRVGQAQNRFGIESAQSSSKRLPLERAVMFCGEGGDPRGLYASGLWDRGIWITRNPTGGDWDPQVIVSAVNGQFRGGEMDNSKACEIDLKWDQDWGLFGASYVRGSFVDAAGLKTDREAIGGHLRWDPVDCRWAFQGEAICGEIFGTDMEGFYGQLEYATGKAGTAFVKYEEFNPIVGTPGEDYDALHVGYAHKVDDNNEITVQLTTGHDRSDVAHPDRTKATLQWQSRF